MSLVACIKQDEAPSDLQRAIPTADQVKIKLPMSANRAITASYTRGPRLEIASCQGSLSKEGFELMVTGDPGVPYEIQATTMLVAPPSEIQWTPLGTVSNVIGMATFLDRTVTNHTQRFYRAVVP